MVLAQLARKVSEALWKAVFIDTEKDQQACAVTNFSDFE